MQKENIGRGVKQKENKEENQRSGHPAPDAPDKTDNHRQRHQGYQVKDGRWVGEIGHPQRRPGERPAGYTAAHEHVPSEDDREQQEEDVNALAVDTGGVIDKQRRHRHQRRGHQAHPPVDQLLAQQVSGQEYQAAENRHHHVCSQDVVAHDGRHARDEQRQQRREVGRRHPGDIEQAVACRQVFRHAHIGGFIQLDHRPR